MRTRMAWLTTVLVLAAGWLGATVTQGQDPPLAKPAPAKLSPLQQQMYHSALRGADWLRRANRPDGRFVPGYLPALRATLENDHYLRQVGAAGALARAARFFGDERLAAVARQAVLTLLLDTTADAKDPQVRYIALPSAAVNRLAAAGGLVLAVHELPAPGDDLLDQAEQLCQFIRRQQRPDGSLRLGDDEADRSDDPEGVSQHPGPALAALMVSQRHRPAAWKTEAVRQALPYYRAAFRDRKHPAFVAWQTAAYTEAFLQTKESVFLEFIGEMNDWVCGLQYTKLDPRHPLRLGGFMGWADGRPDAAAPHVGTAACAAGLAQACRAARAAGDLPRYQRYREALERALQFMTTLQYTEANTQHFAEWYRPALVGGFYVAHQDGTLRLDGTGMAVAALVLYLQESP